jgi:peptide/nickel transport system substrate-binding protein
VVEASAPDERTVVVALDGARCPLLAALGELPILPRHVLAQPDADPIAFGRTPVGSGPFVFLDWTAEGEVRLAGNDDYWGGAPNLDNWSYRPFETPAELGQALQRGQLDAAVLPPGGLEDIDRPPSVDVYRYSTPELLFVAFNNDHPVLGDSRVRRALSMAVDRELLLDQALHGAGELTAASLPAAHWAADAGLQVPPYDPNGARRLLAEAGWSDTDGDGWLDRDDEPLRLPVRTNGGNRLREDLATLVAGYYRAIGVDASVQLTGWGTLVDDLFTHDFEVIVFSWQLAAEPDQSGWWLSTENEVGRGYNFVSFADDTVDRLVQEAATLPGCDASRRARLYRQVQQALAQERPYDFLLMPYGALVTRAGLQGVAAGPFAGPLESAAAWYIARSD